MSLSESMVRASIAVSDLARAEEFYEGGLGLSAIEETPESRIYACGGGTGLHVYVSPTQARGPEATVATWYVGDLEQVVDELASRGVTFERYDEPELAADEKGIHDMGDGKVAWFKDPDGNTFAIQA